MKTRAAALAARGVFVGTSSWKYEGWMNQLYTPALYKKNAKVSKNSADEGWFPQLQIESQPKKTAKIDKDEFERDCLNEYAEVFKTVSVDATYYKFPSQSSLEALAAQVPTDFQFGFKVTGEVTIKSFSRGKHHGSRAGDSNASFLDADLFRRGFLQPCESIRNHVGIIMFEFSRFYSNNFKHSGDFVEVLDSFFNSIPNNWPYGIELRNKDWLTPEYFACLARHGVAHVFNNWTHMPPVSEQMALANSRTNNALVAARFLLKPGRNYEDAVKSFRPYARTQEVNAEARQAGTKLISEGLQTPNNPLRKTYIYVNNRLEGNALLTIMAMMEALEFVT
ncbi:MAG TPA: DUF72 domain-containing protein [Verrucomicrobiae bacterium]